MSTELNNRNGIAFRDVVGDNAQFTLADEDDYDGFITWAANTAHKQALDLVYGDTWEIEDALSGAVQNVVDDHFPRIMNPVDVLIYANIPVHSEEVMAVPYNVTNPEVVKRMAQNAIVHDMEQQIKAVSEHPTAWAGNDETTFEVAGDDLYLNGTNGEGEELTAHYQLLNVKDDEGYILYERTY